MIYLIIAIITSVYISVLFKLYEKYKVDTFQAIVFNYVTCVSTGSIELGYFPIEAESASTSWFAWSIFLGSLFISGFYIVACTVQYFGITIASIMQRMTLIISVGFAILVLEEVSTSFKMIGIGLAILAIILTNIAPPNSKPKESITGSNSKHTYLWLFPILTFLSGGIIECVLQWVKAKHLNPLLNEEAIFTIHAFGFAALLGTLALAFLYLSKRASFSWRNVLGGVALGIPNYFSIYCILLAFDWGDKSVVLPINNIAVLSISAVIGFLYFQERLSKINGLGLVLAILAIYLISAS